MIVVRHVEATECRTIPFVTPDLPPEDPLNTSPNMTPTERRASGTLA